MDLKTQLDMVDELDRLWDRDCSPDAYTLNAFIEAAPVLSKAVRMLQRKLAASQRALTRCRDMLRRVQASNSGCCPICEQWPHTAECELKELL